MLTALITAIIVLAAIAIIVWVAKTVLRQMGAPDLAYTIVVALACLVGLIIIAQAFGLVRLV